MDRPDHTDTHGSDDAAVLFARRVPKAELHMHLTGSLSPAQYIHLRSESGVRPDAAEVDQAYDNRGPGKFFADLELAARLWRDPDHVFEAASAALASAFDHGAQHVELLCTPSLSVQQANVSMDSSLRAVDAAFDQARTRLGLSGGIVVELHRPDGEAAALEVVAEATRLRDDGVGIRGIGNDGDHRGTPIEVLGEAYRRARDAGFRLTGHALSQPDLVFAAEHGFERIDHGWVAAENPELVARLAAAGTVLTFTPMAYVLGGHRAAQAWWQAYRILDHAGIPLVIGTDDPALHHTDLTHSYELVARRLGWGVDELAAAARASFLHSWSTRAEERWIASRLTEIDRLATDPWGRTFDIVST